MQNNVSASTDLKKAPDVPNPLISVLLVNYNGLRHLSDCLSSLNNQTFTDIEIVLVDNNSSDGSVEWIRKHFPNVLIIESKINLGFGGGNNLGIPYCRGKYIYFLNNDTFVESNAIESLVIAIKHNEDVKIFASLLLKYNRPDLVDSAGDTIYSCGKTFSFANYPASMFLNQKKITSACGGAALYSRDLLEEIGYFDEDFFLNYEDLDLSFRAQHAGYEILLIPQSKVRHKGSASLGGKKSRLSLYYQERNFGIFLIKNFPLSVLIRFVPAFAFVKIWGLFSCIWFGYPFVFFKGNLNFLAQIPSAYAKRIKILRKSVITTARFKSLIRVGWLREKILFYQGKYDIPL